MRYVWTEHLYSDKRHAQADNENVITLVFELKAKKKQACDRVLAESSEKQLIERESEFADDVLASRAEAKGREGQS